MMWSVLWSIYVLQGIVAVHVSSNVSDGSGKSFGLEVETGLNLQCESADGGPCFINDHDVVFTSIYWMVQFENGYSDPDFASDRGNFEWITTGPLPNRGYLLKDEIVDAIEELNYHLKAFKGCVEEELTFCMSGKETSLKIAQKMEGKLLFFMKSASKFQTYMTFQGGVKYLVEDDNEEVIWKTSSGFVVKPQVTVGIGLTNLHEEFLNSHKWLTKDVVRVRRGSSANENLEGPFAKFRQVMLLDAATAGAFGTHRTRTINDAVIDGLNYQTASAAVPQLKKIESTYTLEKSDQENFEANYDMTKKKLPTKTKESNINHPIVSTSEYTKGSVDYEYSFEESDDVNELKGIRKINNNFEARGDHCVKWMDGFMTFLRHTIQYSTILDSPMQTYRSIFSPKPWGGCHKDLMGILPKTSPACVYTHHDETGCSWAMDSSYMKQWITGYRNAVSKYPMPDVGDNAELVLKILNSFASSGTMEQLCEDNRNLKNAYMHAFGDGGATVLKCPTEDVEIEGASGPKFKDTVVPHEIRAVTATGAAKILKHFSQLDDIPDIWEPKYK